MSATALVEEAQEPERAKFVDEQSYADERRAPDDADGLCDVLKQSAMDLGARFPDPAKFKRYLIDDLEAQGVIVSKNVRQKFTNENGKTNTANVDLILVKPRHKVAAIICSAERSGRATRLLSATPARRRALIITGPTRLESAPRGIDLVIHPKTLAAETSGGGTIGGRLGRAFPTVGSSSNVKSDRSERSERRSDLAAVDPPSGIMLAPLACAARLEDRIVSTARMAEGAAELAAAARTQRAALKAAKTARATATSRAPGAPDWSGLDQLGNPIVSFDPSHPRRTQFVNILARNPRDKHRTMLAKKIGAEFSRIYERYRRDAERRNGKSFSMYGVPEADRRHCEEAGINCLLAGVTPRQLLEYWDSRVADFTDGNLRIPSLTFLKSASNIDRVLTSSLGQQRERASVERKLKAVDRNTFSGVGGLDARLRPALERHGFPTQAYNDRYLLSIQHNAIAIAKGKHIMLPDGRVRDMAMWAAKYLYVVEKA